MVKKVSEIIRLIRKYQSIYTVVASSMVNCQENLIFVLKKYPRKTGLDKYEKKILKYRDPFFNWKKEVSKLNIGIKFPVRKSEEVTTAINDAITGAHKMHQIIYDIREEINKY